METDGGKAEDMRLLDQACARLMEHFDTVQILATRRHEDGETISAASGQGNFYARYGQAKLWLMREERLESAEDGEGGDANGE